MECKFCKAEMDEEAKVCPACGKSVEEETEQVAAAEAEEEIVETAEESEEVKATKKKIKPWQLALVIVGGLVLLAALAYFVLKGMGINIGPRANDIYRKDSYTVSGEKADIFS